MIKHSEFLRAKEIVIQYWIENDIDIGVTPKMKEAELYVDTIINKNGKPPTYRNVAKNLNIKSVCAAYQRLRRYRNKMKKNKY